jgi:hypothetical protein
MYTECLGKSLPKLDLKVEMRTLCSIFVEIESTSDKYKYEYKYKLNLLTAKLREDSLAAERRRGMRSTPAACGDDPGFELGLRSARARRSGGVVQGGGELRLAFYRVEREGERTTKAVLGGGRHEWWWWCFWWERKVARRLTGAPLSIDFGSVEGDEGCGRGKDTGERRCGAAMGEAGGRREVGDEPDGRAPAIGDWE